MNEKIKNLHLIPGISGCGKTTIAREMSSEIDCAKMVVGYTTRPPRDGERDGIDYNFRDIGHLRSKIGQAGWRYSEIHGNYYYSEDKETLPDDGAPVSILPVSFSALDEVVCDYSRVMPEDCSLSVLPIIIDESIKDEWLAKVQPLRPDRDLANELYVQNAALDQYQFDEVYCPKWDLSYDVAAYTSMYNSIRRGEK